MTKPADTAPTTASEQDTAAQHAEAAITDSAAPDASAKNDIKAQPAPAGTSHGGRNFILIVLLIAAAVLGSLALSGKLLPLYASLTARLHPATIQQPHPATVQAVSVKPAPVKQPTAPVSTPEPALRRSAAPQAAVSSDAVRALLASIKALRDQLQHMSDAQQALQNGLLEQQQMNLQVRLRWITDPASRLPQIQLAWEEISLLPGLSDAQRDQAVRMHTLARARVQQVKQWQDALNTWADALVTPVHRNILPEPPYPWLAWIVSQFQLRQAPSAEARHLGDLRTRLLDVSRHLTLESWPAKGAWQSLQAELLLQIKAMQRDGGQHGGEAIETGLPESFDAIQADIATLRRTALQWQQGGAR